MSYENILIEVNEGVGVLTINRPDALNALNGKTLEELKAGLKELEANGECKVVVLTGVGKSFVAGADISEMAGMSSAEASAWADKGQDVFNTAEQLEKPVIAAINGFALGGGCELAIACDIRIASEKAKMGQPEVGLGVIPGFGGTQRLPRLIGKGQAKILIYGGGMIRADEALAIGLVDKVVAPEALMAETLALAKEIASKGQLAVRAAKRAINDGLEGSQAAGLKLEQEIFGSGFDTEDQKEGMKAFLEKRKPDFKEK